MFNLNDSITDFAENLRRMFPPLTCDFSHFLDDESVGKEMFEYVRNLNSSLIKAKEEESELESRHLDIMVEVGENGPAQGLSAVRSLKSEASKKQSKIKEMNIKLQSYQKLIMAKDAQHKEDVETFKNRTAEAEAQTAKWKEEYSRLQLEKRLLNSQMKTQLRANENSFHQQLDEFRVKLQDAKQNPTAFVTHNFCALFDVKNTLDDSNFETFILNVRNKLSALLALESNLRELLNLGPNQSIEDSVSALLLGSN